MRKLIGNLPVFLLAIAILAVSCDQNPAPFEPGSKGTANEIGTTYYVIPAGATLQSATFNVYISAAPNQTVNIHRATAPWDENTVTYNSFADSYDPAIITSFVSAANGFISVDITGLVQSWLDGTYENDGLFLEQGTTQFTQYLTSEVANVDLRPYFELCFNTGGGTECVTIKRGVEGAVADTYLRWNTPDVNYGDSDYLYTGLLSGQKDGLFWFELPEMEEIAAIGDFVWFDDNMNGIQDDGELGFPGVEVHLYDCADNLIGTTFTDENGYYLFSNLVPGDYNVKFFAPEGYAFTLQDQGGDDALDSDADPSTGVAICTTLDNGETDLTWDAGLYMIPQEGCTLTIGYWKTHAGFGPQPDMVTALLPIWLGTPGGTHSVQVTTAAMAVDYLSQFVYGVPSNGITKLYAQLLGAKLNIANGADNASAAAAIAAADAFLANYDWTAWSSLSKSNKKLVLGWQSLLDEYNNGDIGPGHCG